MGAKDAMQYGDRIFLPKTVEELSSAKMEKAEKVEGRYNEEEQKFVQSLELYKVLMFYKFRKLRAVMLFHT